MKRWVLIILPCYPVFQPHGTARLDPTQLMLGTFYFSQEQTVFKDGGLEVLEITGKNNGKYIFLRQSCMNSLNFNNSNDRKKHGTSLPSMSARFLPDRHSNIERNCQDVAQTHRNNGGNSFLLRLFHWQSNRGSSASPKVTVGMPFFFF